MKAIKILAKIALLSALILFPESIRAQSSATPGSPSGNTFAAITPVMNTARDDATATLLPNGKVLIAGGSGSDGSSLRSTELYDPATNTFAPSASTPMMNAARAGATATLLRDGKVLIAGGNGDTDNLSSTELYDPATNKFAPAALTPVMNIARELATATLLPTGKVLIAGGYGDADIVSSTELYDPRTNTFAAAASTPVMNGPRSFAAATLLFTSKVLIAGGITEDSTGDHSVESTELYDPATNTFAAAASTPVMNSPREYATATLLRNGKVVIAGGEVVFEDVLNSTELYDPKTNTFATAASTPLMNAGRIFATATLLRNGSVLIAGGQNLVSSHLYNSISSTDLYNPTTNTFAASASMPAMNTARDLATATLLPSGKVLIAGGESLVGAPPHSIVLSSTELYSPERSSWLGRLPIPPFPTLP